MEVQDDPVEPVEAGVVGHHANVLQRACVAGNGHPALVVGGGRLYPYAIIRLIAYQFAA